MDHSTMDHSDMDHGHDHGGGIEDMCNMNVSQVTDVSYKGGH